MLYSKSVLTTCSLLLITSQIFAQSQPGTVGMNIKPDEMISRFAAVATDVAPKASIVPFDHADWESLISLDKSGDGNINLPVVVAKGRKLSLPISLTYNTNGIKINQKSSEVGLGWNISFGSIIRDYGAFEPDYTYTGPEHEMLAIGGNFSRQLISGGGVHPIDPVEHGTRINYDGINPGVLLPDEYIVNIPGREVNAFWNHNPGANPSTPHNFVFTKDVHWKIEHDVHTFQFAQEISRINEFNYVRTTAGSGYDKLDNKFNIAAAIAFYPYVKNQYFRRICNGPDQAVSHVPENGNIAYEDFSQFTLTATDGTQYVFGMPLRGQKYLIEESPFWCAMPTKEFFENNPISVASDAKAYGEFWKTEFIAEWLLTEIKSSDYVDANNNGYPDDGDAGDWIKIDYTPPSKEYLNFTQTDKESSIWRERAYVQKITTPVQEITFATSPKLDIDFDYFNRIFNRVNNQYTYDEYPGFYASSSTTLHYATSNSAAYDQNPDDLSLFYPLELKKYDAIAVKDRLTNNVMRNVKFVYAPHSATEELAYSKYSIMDNNGNFYSYDPSFHADDGVLDAYRFEKTNGNGRGKLTLKAIEFRGSDINASPIKYSFDYILPIAAFSDIHLHDIRKMAVYSTIRESLRSNNGLRWQGVKEVENTYLGRSYLPWKWFMLEVYNNAFFDVEYGQNSTTYENYITNQVLDYPNPIYSDELGYYYNTALANNGRDIWSLNKITLPYGGTVSIEYERDQIDIATDRNKWKEIGIPDYATPSVGHYNNIAHLRNIQQGMANSGAYNEKKLYKEYYYLMNQYSGGLRIKNIAFADVYGNPTITRTYNYGTGHYTMPPADYWHNYLQGLSAFIADETERHYINEIYLNTSTTYPDFQHGMRYNDYTRFMSRLITNTRVGNTVKNQSKHYYEYIEQQSSDNSKTRWYYGRLIPDVNQANPRRVYHATHSAVIKKLMTQPNSMVDVLATETEHNKEIGNYKTEYYDNNNSIVKETSTEYEFFEAETNTISTSNGYFNKYRYGYWVWGSQTYSTPNGNQTVYGLEQYNPNYDKQFYELMTAGFCQDIGYANGTLSSAPFEINIVGEAKEPLSRIRYVSGAPMGSKPMPSWFAGITNTPNTWSNYTNSQITTLLHDLKGDLWMYNWSNDDKCRINALTYKSHQSYVLRPKTIISRSTF